MISQQDLQEYLTLVANQEKLKEFTDRFKRALDTKEEVEPGNLALKVTKSMNKSTKWKVVVDRIVEAHPEVKDLAVTLETANTHTHDSYRVEVVPALNGRTAIYKDTSQQGVNNG
jgi:hypothetical protein